MRGNRGRDCDDPRRPILVVDDDAPIREGIADLLRDDGFQVLHRGRRGGMASKRCALPPVLGW
jgi:CheY-like chemotaxis protein